MKSFKKVTSIFFGMHLCIWKKMYIRDFCKTFLGSQKDKKSKLLDGSVFFVPHLNLAFKAELELSPSFELNSTEKLLTTEVLYVRIVHHIHHTLTVWRVNYALRHLQREPPCKWLCEINLRFKKLWFVHKRQKKRENSWKIIIVCSYHLK